MSVRTETIQHYTCDCCRQEIGKDGHNLPNENLGVDLRPRFGALDNGCNMTVLWRYYMPNPTYSPPDPDEHSMGIGRFAKTINGHLCKPCLKAALIKMADSLGETK